MSIPQEHDYIGLSEPLSLEQSSEKKNGLNLKETELRLGLPGSESPERWAGPGVSIFGKDLKDDNNGGNGFSKNLVTGAKRVFSDSIGGSVKWGLGINGGSEGNLGISVGGDCKGKNSLPMSSVKEIVPPVKKPVEEKKSGNCNNAPAAKAQVVGWPPIRSFRKNTLATNLPKNDELGKKSSGPVCLYVKVSMDGAPYLRKIDLKTYSSYPELSSALGKMFSCFTIEQCAGQGQLSESRLMDLLNGSEYVLTYEDKDGDWMLVGDVPWEMFMDSCKRLRIMKGSDAIGLAPRTMQKCRSEN
ncbi:Auxin-responsive protein IAA27 [Striga hermonthica]|uniref:Auxin-responsive protein n=1 Tax=Striga hermonthica TaxID=68872 RepID=A0A9N7NKH9_STRHE|nr:Auxin-responsive protein IAA27 [Striga hermonthica]